MGLTTTPRKTILFRNHIRNPWPNWKGRSAIGRRRTSVRKLLGATLFCPDDRNIISENIYHVTWRHTLWDINILSDILQDISSLPVTCGLYTDIAEMACYSFKLLPALIISKSYKESLCWLRVVTHSVLITRCRRRRRRRRCCCYCCCCCWWWWWWYDWRFRTNPSLTRRQCYRSAPLPYPAM